MTETVNAPSRTFCTLRFAATVLHLLAQRAIWWPSQRTLLVADMHLGKPASYRAQGAPVPEAITIHDLQRLDALVQQFDAQRIVFLGDLAHDPAAWRAHPLQAFAQWRRTHAALDLVLVRGNHDRRASDPPADLTITCVEPGWKLGAIELHHEPDTVSASPALCGHVHPGIRLVGSRGRRGMRAACFWFTENRGMLPAFGSFTGCAMIRPGRDDKVYAIGDGQIHPLQIPPVDPQLP